MSPSPATATGRVVELDDVTGLGTIAGDDGTTVPFHCVEVADGSRAIDPGTAVVFSIVVKLGATEATGIVKLPPGGDGA